jgi:hypothetical protein
MHDAIWLLAALTAVAIICIIAGALRLFVRRGGGGEHRGTGRAKRPHRDPHDPVAPPRGPSWRQWATELREPDEHDEHDEHEEPS